VSKGRPAQRTPEERSARAKELVEKRGAEANKTAKGLRNIAEQREQIAILLQESSSLFPNCRSSWTTITGWRAGKPLVRPA